MQEDLLLLLPLWYIVFLMSTTCHEAAHGWAAWIGGDPTAYHGGQVSLNPLPHVRRELFGTVIVPIVSYLVLGWNNPAHRWMIGWASAPFDPGWEERHPRRAALMALAGPLANLGLGGIGFSVLSIGLTQGWWVPAVVPSFDGLVEPGIGGAVGLSGLGRLCSVVLCLNTVLFVFNLLPLPPLDGAAVLSGVFSPLRRVYQLWRQNEFSGIIGLLVAWYVFPALFRPVFLTVLGWLFGG